MREGEGRRRRRLLTEVGRIVVFRAIDPYGGQIRYQVLANPGKHTLTVGHYVNVIEHFEKFGAGRVY